MQDGEDSNDPTQIDELFFQSHVTFPGYMIYTQPTYPKRICVVRVSDLLSQTSPYLIHLFREKNNCSHIDCCIRMDPYDCKWQKPNLVQL